MLFSLHLKATMMKVSDPIMFGHAVSVFYKDVFAKHAALFDELGVDAEQRHRRPSTTKIADAAGRRSARRSRPTSHALLRDSGPPLAMVNSDKGITNLHVPSDVIVDASMPAMIRASGQMWGPDGKLQDTKAVIPDRCYAGIYQEVDRRLQDARRVRSGDDGHRAERRPDGAEGRGIRLARQDVRDRRRRRRVRVDDAAGNVLMEHAVEPGDIWRMCQTKDAAIHDWVKLAVNRARAHRTRRRCSGWTRRARTTRS